MVIDLLLTADVLTETQEAGKSLTLQVLSQITLNSGLFPLVPCVSEERREGDRGWFSFQLGFPTTTGPVL